jgi:membrane fusion protein, copper/silver efflux system
MKNILKNRWIVVVLVLIVGIVIGKLMGGGDSSNKEVGTHIHDETEQEQIWTCSMHPQIQQNGPGQCPLCGMDLIPLDNSMESGEALPDEVPMSASAMKLAEIQTYVVKKENPQKEIRLLGKVKADERLIFSQAVHFPGRIEKLFINFTGEKVVKGQKLATIYSSELITAQKELFEVLKDQSTNPALVKAARNKLKQWKFTDQQIERIEKSGEVQNEVDILSDHNGYVMMLMTAEGDYVKAGQILLEVTDLSKVWLLFEAYENDLPWVKLGDELDIELKAIPGKTFKEKVTFIDPFINPKTRVANVRVELSNSKGLLKPDMFANGIITSKLPIDGEVILVPKSAVLWTGKRAIVYIKLPNREHNSFIYREVILGEDAGEFYVVKEGLEEGEEIATNGVFKIDAAAQLAGKKSMMNPTGGKVAMGHNHGGDDNKEMDMSNMDMEKEVMIDKSKVSSKFKTQLGGVVNHYLSIKDRLVNDDANIQSDVKTLQKSLKNVDMSLVMEDAHNVWMDALKSMNKDLKLLSKAVNIDEQRTIFLTISKSLSDATQKLGVEMKDNQTIYLEFCPMANEDKGGYWLSTEKEIKNPYFGSKMLKCGEVKETITKQ